MLSNGPHPFVFVVPMSRLLPFSVFIIVPFGELALPFAVKLFPNLLPSTFQDKKSVEDTRRANMKMKIDMAQFLQEAVEEMAVTRKKFHSVYFASSSKCTILCG